MNGSACVSWFCRTQKCVTLSRTEAEYVALTDVVKKTPFFRHVWRFILPSVGMLCIPVLEDNQGAVQLAQDPITNSNSTHVHVRHQLLRELVGRKTASIFHVPSPFQRANFLSKTMPREGFEFHRNLAMNLW